MYKQMQIRGYSSELTEDFRSEMQRWTLHSVFHRVINLESGGRLIAIQSGELPWNSFACTLKEPVDFTEVLRDADAGMPVWLGRSGIRLRDRIILPAADPEIYLSALPLNGFYGGCSLKNALERFLSGENKGCAAAIWGDEQDWKGDIVIAELSERLFSFESALKAGNEEVIRMTAAGLVGCGGGLTPSGDDFLCGVIDVLRILPKEETEAAWESAIREAVCAEMENTVRISRAYLEESLAGRGGQQLHALITAVQNGEAPEPILESIAKTGHSSGIDRLCGMWMLLDRVF